MPFFPSLTSGTWGLNWSQGYLVTKFTVCTLAKVRAYPCFQEEENMEGRGFRRSQFMLQL